MSTTKKNGKMVTICKEFDFDAAHRLPRVPEGHKCGRMHGHTYRVQLVFSGDIDDETGWFMDYADIAAAWAPLNAVLDHHTLNEIPGLENPTTEVLAHWILSRLKAEHLGRPFWSFLRTVRIYESSTTYCEAHVWCA